MTTTMNTRVPKVAAPIFTRHLVDGWRGQLGWSVGIAAVIGMYLPLFPSLQSPDLEQLIDSLPSELVNTLGFDQIASGTGYTQATFFGLLGFVLAAIASISWGSAFIAGTEESGRLELTLAHTVGRTQYALESAAALIVKILALGAVAFLLILAINTPAELDLSGANLLATTLAWVSLGLVSGLAALAFGAMTGRRSWAIGAGASIAVIGYGLDTLGGTSEDLDWLTIFSPYHWAFGRDPLAEGFDWGGLALLWGLSAVLIGITAWALSRRDILG
ncbi:hypothetical protein CATRI_11215 [Corynebacterium atrinae]|uniref:ABC transporter permease subunit n=1 Tax=Corynebacterium atrinae TaxID=1336740 RepID=UPI0025B42E4F|nr:ABC transporter permease subunit [Corynebacterium atrinae]WJY64293.1 hypothetical protein CATRI_11215 [Corynebacterium atrinae]